MEWYHTILPRINRFLPTQTILEIACGFGRWSNYLVNYCEELLLVDFTKECVDSCRKRFTSESKVKVFQNDGLTLGMAEDSSVDFVFSFDSLVHCDAYIIESYLREISRVLKPDGTVFLHHSNLASYKTNYPRALKRALYTLGLLPHEMFRASDVSATIFKKLTEQSGLSCVNQETVTWTIKRFLLDCFSTTSKSGGKWDKPYKLFENRNFYHEIHNASLLSKLYDRC